MIYLKRGPDEPAAVETEERASAREAAGYTRCTSAAHRAAWQAKDNAARLELAQADLRALQRMSYADRVKRGV